MLAGILAIIILSILLNSEPRIVAYNNLFCLRISANHKNIKILSICAYWYVRFCLILAVSVFALYLMQITQFIIGICFFSAAILYFLINFKQKTIYSAELSAFIFGGKHLPLSVRQGLTFPFSSMPIILSIAGLNSLVNQPIFVLVSSLLCAALITAPVIIKSINISLKELKIS